MNYRHAFHAGNFADLVKHAGLTLLLDALMADPEPLRVIDTHAGAGGYDLTGELSRRTGEAAQGIFRLMADEAAPAPFFGLKRAVSRGNQQDAIRFYPGSPSLIAHSLRAGDRYLACELREDDGALLSRTLASFPNAEARLADGYLTARMEGRRPGRLLVLIDPPFERADDYAQIASVMEAILPANPGACIAAWLPLKDLETLDAFARSIAPTAPGALVAECRLRPLDNPMKMNGCALVIARPPAGIEPPLQQVCDWVARLGEGRGKGELWRLDG